MLEYLDGGTLAQKIVTRKKKAGRATCKQLCNNVHVRDALSDSHAIARAMEYCHEGINECIIIHRDLKPDNIGEFF